MLEPVHHVPGTWWGTWWVTVRHVPGTWWVTVHHVPGTWWVTVNAGRAPAVFRVVADA